MKNTTKLPIKKWVHNMKHWVAVRMVGEGFQLSCLESAKDREVQLELDLRRSPRLRYSLK